MHLPIYALNSICTKKRIHSSIYTFINICTYQYMLLSIYVGFRVGPRHQCAANPCFSPLSISLSPTSPPPTPLPPAFCSPPPPLPLLYQPALHPYTLKATWPPTVLPPISVDTRTTFQGNNMHAQAAVFQLRQQHWRLGDATWRLIYLLQKANDTAASLMSPLPGLSRRRTPNTSPEGSLRPQGAGGPPGSSAGPAGESVKLFPPECSVPVATAVHQLCSTYWQNA